jgi:hypothetical protein
MQQDCVCEAIGVSVGRLPAIEDRGQQIGIVFPGGSGRSNQVAFVHCVCPIRGDAEKQISAQSTEQQVAQRGIAVIGQADGDRKNLRCLGGLALMRTLRFVG